MRPPRERKIPGSNPACAGIYPGSSHTSDLKNDDGDDDDDNDEEDDDEEEEEVYLLVGDLTSPQQASVSQGRICSDNLTCCHIEIEERRRRRMTTMTTTTTTTMMMMIVIVIIPFVSWSIERRRIMQSATA